MALDLLPDNHPGVDPASVFIRNFAVPIAVPSRHTANAILPQAGLPKAF